jgi:hypothetical protein
MGTYSFCPKVDKHGEKLFWHFEIAASRTESPRVRLEKGNTSYINGQLVAAQQSHRQGFRKEAIDSIHSASVSGIATGGKDPVKSEGNYNDRWSRCKAITLLSANKLESSRILFYST